ncbi:hypothetical protein [Pseudomonas phage 98PfluR60PP]|uniref:Uncharacterized protein n=1 Tax=Pseudomonas phage 98PfluR60PP TaxID=2163965 RepID=A0A2S1PFX4_9CAUD|nr:hypothetical protein PP760_gp28 [Pseudomonas phage 98PfluR60PP]AWH15460.1 hypothetical protein [Pseudomonas phage 98PfluR60PP]
MPQGLECYEDDGVTLTMSVTDRVTKILGSIDTGVTAGTFHVPAFAEGTPWVSYFAYNNEHPNSITAKVSVNTVNNTIEWNFNFENPFYPPPFARLTNTKIFYGIR